MVLVSAQCVHCIVMTIIYLDRAGWYLLHTDTHTHTHSHFIFIFVWIFGNARNITTIFNGNSFHTFNRTHIYSVYLVSSYLCLVAPNWCTSKLPRLTIKPKDETIVFFGGRLGVGGDFLIIRLQFRAKPNQFLFILDACSLLLTPSLLTNALCSYT